MCVNEAFAYQPERAGIEHKINKLRKEYKVINVHKSIVAAGLLGPDS